MATGWSERFQQDIHCLHVTRIAGVRGTWNSQDHVCHSFEVYDRRALEGRARWFAIPLAPSVAVGGLASLPGATTCRG